MNALIFQIISCVPCPFSGGPPNLFLNTPFLSPNGLNHIKYKITLLSVVLRGSGRDIGDCFLISLEMFSLSEHEHE